MATFKEDLTRLINAHSLEGTSGTPDYILASYMAKCLEAFEGSVIERDNWHRRRFLDPREVKIVEEAIWAKTDPTGGPCQSG